MKKHLPEVLLMSTHNICFCREIRNYRYISTEKSALSGAMISLFNILDIFNWADGFCLNF